MGLGDNEKRSKFTEIVLLPKNVGRINQVLCGRHHTIIVNENNEFFGCGYNSYGGLGLGNDID